ncbi:MAG TPA: hypothetical protein VHY91_11510 [Pirellulales bacterium]|jgi:hypothetical protein|nr:hypothetical protein [Pirellulales bacterium]
MHDTPRRLAGGLAVLWLLLSGLAGSGGQVEGEQGGERHETD